MAPGRELALWAKAGIAINRPFCYFCGYDKSNGPLRPRADGPRLLAQTKVKTSLIYH